jgi:hypothetical protein
VLFLSKIFAKSAKLLAALNENDLALRIGLRALCREAFIFLSCAINRTGLFTEVG